jgi:protein pelota
MTLRIIETNLKKGIVKVIPESFDDLWHLYNIIYRDDRIFAQTTREMEPIGEYARPKRGQRIPVFMGIQVEKVDLDKLLSRLRVHGIIREGPKSIPMGAHHTINIVLNKPLTVVKEKWSKHHLERLERAKKTSEKPMMIISIDDEGYAIATTKQYGIEVRVEERIQLPGKLEAEKRSTAMKEYFRGALSSLRRVWRSLQSPIVIIGVGFIKDDFAKFLKNEAKDMAESVVDVKSVNNGGVAGIYEALRSGVLLKTIKHMRITQEINVMKEILKRLAKNEYNIAYGLDQVKKAVKLGAVEKIVLADDTLRRAPDHKRLILEELMKTVENKGGEVMILSTEHEAGVELMALGGVAALLRFSVG